LVAARHKAWCEANPEKVKAHIRAWDKANREKKLSAKKTWYRANRERIAKVSKAYHETNREKAAIRAKAWIKANPEKKADQFRRRRARKKFAFVFLTETEKAKLHLLENTRRTLQSETGRKYDLDHILPLSHGGIHHPINLRILEGSENRSKHDKLLPEAIDLAYEHYKLYYERISPERAEEFVKQLAKAIGLNENEIDLKRGVLPSLPKRATLEDYME
jgi:hypothetical protein